MEQVLNAKTRPAHAKRSKRLLALRGDEQIVIRVRAGDAAAFEVLYDRYAEVLLSFCRHMLGRPDEAEDAVQQVFVSAHAAMLRDDRPVELKPWLYAIARNRCLSILRARREIPDAELRPTVDGLQDEVQSRADLRELVADLGDLPENQRAALLLTELDDLSHADAASVLDCEASQVKGLVFRARAGLIERRDSRATPCESIREELSTARRGTLRKGHLRHHLKQCPGCTAYLEDVRRQRRMMALILPVVPGFGLKRSVLAAAGIGGTSGGAGLTLAGGSAVTGIAVKVAAAGVLIAGAGVAGREAPDQAHEAQRAKPPASVSRQAPATPRRSTPAANPGAVRSKAKATAARRTARRRAATSASNRGASPKGRVSNPGRGVGPKRSLVPAAPQSNGNRGTPSSTAGGGTRAHGAPAPAPQAGPKHRANGNGR